MPFGGCMVEGKKSDKTISMLGERFQLPDV